MKSFLKRLVAFPKWSLVLPILVFFTTLPALWVGYQVDDYFHLLRLRGHITIHGKGANRYDLFKFLDGVPEHVHTQIDEGFLPWWTYPRILASFWRPLSAATHVLDGFLWPDSPQMKHLHSIAWYILLVLLVMQLYRALFRSPWGANLAGLFFAFDLTHGWAVGWLANRNALVAAVFGVLVLLLHHKTRQEKWNIGRLLSPAMYAGALLAGESAIAVIAYLCAYALFIDEASRLSRLRSLIPYAVITVLWRIVYQSMGYGAKGMDLYLDPMREPLAFAAAMITRAPILLGAQFGCPPAFPYVFLSVKGIAVLLALGLITLTVVAYLVVPLIRTHREAMFWITGSLLAVVPICATFPHERLLLYVSIGAMAVLAMFVEAVLFQQKEYLGLIKGFRMKIVTIAMYFVIIIRLFINPVMLAVNVYGPKTLEMLSTKVFEQFPNDQSFFEKELIVVNSPVPFTTQYLPIVRFINREAYPKRMRILGSGTAEIKVHRIDEKNIDMACDEGFLRAPFDDLFRKKDNAFQVGDQVLLTGLTITILEIDGTAHPMKLRFSFNEPLEHPAYLWYYFNDGRYQPFQIPQEGQTVTVPKQDYDPLNELINSL